jgi:hypothetical protein
MKDFWSQPIKDQAYYIVVGFCGSWMYEVLLSEMEDEEFCRKLVNRYRDDYGDEVVEQVQAFYDDRVIEHIPDKIEVEKLPEPLRYLVK